jgi:flagellar basal body-associated protein FliL
MLQIILASIIFVGIAVAAIAIKMFFVKDSSFEKQCSCGNNKQGSCSTTCDEIETNI